MPRRHAAPGTPSTGLPARASSFVGREREIAEIAAALGGGARLVTVLGPAGVGKTRLALEAAGWIMARPSAVLAPGWWPTTALFCDLSEVREAAEVAPAILSAIGAARMPGGDEIGRVGKLLAARGRALLILDNMEQVAAGAAEATARLLAGAPGLAVIATSRERLRVQGETVIDLAPLAVPPADDADPEGAPAVRLFLDRARAASPAWAGAPGDAAIVAAIVRRLEGFPLAIELCAPRSRVLDPAALRDRLDRGFDVLAEGARDAGGRHLTLARAIGWSWELLAPHERSALAQCSVFAGSFSMDAAEAVIAPGEEGAPPALAVVAALVDKSLVRADTGADRRLALYASVRDHAARALAEAGGAAAAEARHARHYLALGERLARQMETTGSAARAELGRERDQLVAVHARAIAGGRAAEALAAALLLDEILAGMGPVREHLAPIDAAIRLAESAEVEPALLSRALEARAGALRAAGRGAEARADLDRAVALAAAARAPAAEARARSGLCVLLRGEHRLAEARAEGELALAGSRAAGLARFEIYALGALGAIELEASDLEAAGARFERAAALARRIGDRWSEAMATAFQGHVHEERAALAGARGAYTRAAAAFAELGDLRHAAIFGGYLAGVLHAEGDPGAARAGYARVAARLAEIEVPRFEGLFRARLGAAAADLGLHDEARGELAAAAERLARAGDPALSLALEVHRLHLDVGSPGGAAVAAAKRDALVEGSPLVAASDDVRFALRILQRALDAAARRRPARAAALVIGNEARWFELPGEPRVSLDRKRSLRLLLAALAGARLRAPGRALDRDALLAAGWPGERIQPAAGAHRVRVAIASLRALGLRGLLASRDDGYLLDPTAEIEQRLDGADI